MHPRLAMVSTGIRRDLTAPVRYFSKFEILHFYGYSAYGDLSPADLDSSLHQYTSALDLYRQLVAARPDVIQGPEPLSYFSQPLLWASYFAARRVNASHLLVTHENRPLDLKFGRVRAALLRAMLKPILKSACLILVLNDGARENMLACGVPNPRIIRAMWGSWGVDTADFTPHSVRNSDAALTILFVGRLHAEKGVNYLLDAFGNVREQIPPARLIFVGDGPERAALQERANALYLADAVTFTGTVKHHAMPDQFRAADVFCAPSVTTRKWAEQVGSASLQAMASGIPIVTTHSGAIPEYVPDGIAGILVPERDAGALATALGRVLKDAQLRAELGQRGRAYACAHYDARANVLRAEQLVMEHCLARRV